MKYTGMVRRLDEMGRIILPVELRRHCRIRKGANLEFSLRGDCVVLRKHGQNCIFCDSSDDLMVFRGKHVCRKCIADAKSIH